MADQNVTAGIRGVQALADKENELRRVKETLQREQAAKSAAEIKLAAAETRLKSMVPASQVPSMAPVDDGLSTRIGMAQANVQAAAQAHAARQATYEKMAAGGWGAPKDRSEAERIGKLSESDNGVSKITELTDAIGPMTAKALTLGAAFRVLSMAVEQATAAENARRARSMSANEALGMVGALPPELEKIVSSGASAGNGLGAISPDDARAIASQYGSSLAELGAAAPAVSPQDRARQLQAYIDQRRRGVSMAGIGAAIGQKGSPFLGVETAFTLAGVPTQTGLGRTEVQEAAAVSVAGAAAQNVRTPFRDAAFRAQSEIQIARDSGNFLASIPGATTALTLDRYFGSSFDATGIPGAFRNLASGDRQLLDAMKSWFFGASTIQATRIPSQREGREGQ
jgi:hypothetical protein